MHVSEQTTMLLLNLENRTYCVLNKHWLWAFKYIAQEVWQTLGKKILGKLNECWMNNYDKIAQASKSTDKHEPTKNHFPLHCLRGIFLLNIKVVLGRFTLEEKVLRAYIHVQVKRAPQILYMPWNYLAAHNRAIVLSSWREGQLWASEHPPFIPTWKHRTFRLQCRNPSSHRDVMICGSQTMSSSPLKAEQTRRQRRPNTTRCNNIKY